MQATTEMSLISGTAMAAIRSGMTIPGVSTTAPGKATEEASGMPVPAVAAAAKQAVCSTSKQTMPAGACGSMAVTAFAGAASIRIAAFPGSGSIGATAGLIAATAFRRAALE